MGDCEYIRIPKKKLCPGSLDKLIDIQKRAMGETTFGNSAATENFTLIKQVWASLVTPNTIGAGVRRFNGVTLNKRTTHIWYINFDPDLKKLEISKTFIHWDSDRFEVLSVLNDNENNEFLFIESTNKGIDTKEGSKA
jgi:hypothetical protein